MTNRDLLHNPKRLYTFGSGKKTKEEIRDLLGRLGTVEENLNAKKLGIEFFKYFEGKKSVEPVIVYDGLEYINAKKHDITRPDLLKKLTAAGYKLIEPPNMFDSLLASIMDIFPSAPAACAQSPSSPVKSKKSTPISKPRRQPMTLFRAMLNISKRIYSGDYMFPVIDEDDGRAGKLCEIFAESHDPGDHANLDFIDGELKTVSVKLTGGRIEAKGGLSVMSDANFRNTPDLSRERLFGNGDTIGKITNILCICCIHLRNGKSRAAVYCEPVHVDDMPINTLKADFANIIGGSNGEYLAFVKDAFFLKPKFVDDFVISKFSKYEPIEVEKRNGIIFKTDLSSNIAGLPPRQQEAYNILYRDSYRHCNEETELE